MPTPYTMKFIIIVWLAFLARHRPVSTMANPACMNMTRKPVTSVQTKLIAITFWPTIETTSASVSPAFASPIGMSAAVPVIVPAGSPFALSSADGVGTPLMSASVIIFGPAAAAAAGAAAAGSGAGAGAWANTGEQQITVSSSACAPESHFFIVIDSSLFEGHRDSQGKGCCELRLLLPHGVLLIGGIDDAQNANQADDDAGEHHD